MNKRIRVLAIQSDCKIDGMGYGEGDLEKFAELIVRECEAILKKDMELAHIQLIPLDFKMYANGRLQRTIKEHFGLKE
jgi:hypothetical protein